MNCESQRRQGIDYASRGIELLCNVRTAKLTALTLVMLLILYHANLQRKGIDSCQLMLSVGRFLDYDVWQPYGCLMHYYTPENARECLKRKSAARGGRQNHLTFVGDSKIRYLYIAASNFIKIDGHVISIPDLGHQDQSYTDNETNTIFDMRWIIHPDDSMKNVYRKWISDVPSKRPDFIITCSTSWSIAQNHGSEQGFQTFKDQLSQMPPILEQMRNTTKIIWMIQEPMIEKRHSNYQKSIKYTNANFNRYNNATIDILKSSYARLCTSSRRIAFGYLADPRSKFDDGVDADGQHAGKRTLYWNVQMIFNLLCNEKMKYSDSSCCRSAARLSAIQIVVACLLFLSFPLATVLFIWRSLNQMWCVDEKIGKVNSNLSWMFQKTGMLPLLSAADNDSSQTAKNDNQSSSIIANNDQSSATISNMKHVQISDNSFTNFVNLFFRLSLVMAYFVVCDRIPLFMKDVHIYSHIWFFLPLASFFILGLCWSGTCKQSEVLNRDQTDECKGWMQLAILIYHWTDASHILSIYIHIRLLVSAYVFLSAFGHVTYFINKADYSFHRYCTVMFRMNFLVVTLCLIMNRPYQFYYFVPLISYWFTITFLMFAFWPRLQVHILTTDGDNNLLQYICVLVKIIILTSVVVLLNCEDWLFEKIFGAQFLRFLFISEDKTISNWRLCWQLDRYSWLYGMVFAIVVVMWKKHAPSDTSEISNKVSSCYTSIMSILFGAILLASWRQKQEINK